MCIGKRGYRAIKKPIKALILLFFLHLSFSSCGQHSLVDELNDLSFELRSTDRDSAKILAQRALTEAREVSYAKGIGISQLNLGIYYCNKDQLDSANFFLEGCRSFLTSADDSFYRGLHLWYMGKLFQKLGDFDKSFGFLNKSESIFRETNEEFLTYVLTEQGTYHAWQGNYPKALGFYLEAHELNYSRDSTGYFLRDYNNIASLYIEMGNQEEAMKYIGRMHKQLKNDMNSAYSPGDALFTLGNIYMRMKKRDSALYYYRKSLDIPTNKSELQARILSSLADLFIETNEYALANKYLEESLNYGNGVTLVNSYLKLGQNYRQLHQVDDALFYLMHGTRLARKRGSKKQMMQLSEALHNIYKDQEIYDSAYFYSRLELAYSDSLYNDRSQKEFNHLRIQMETLEKENEISLLRAAQYKSGLKAAMAVSVMLLVLTVMAVLFLIHRARQKKKQEQLKMDLLRSQNNLSNHTLAMVQKNHLIDEIKCAIEELPKKNGNFERHLVKILNKLQIQRSSENDWENFTSYFSELHLPFLKQLDEINPKLSEQEVRLCALVKLKLTTKEIASVLRIEDKSVRMAKYRLKKKLKLEPETDLNDFIHRSAL